MMTSSRFRALMFAVSVATVACGNDDPLADSGGAPPKKAKAAAAKPNASAEQGAEQGKATGAPRSFKDTDFVESEQNRDPFRNFLNEMKGKGPMVAQRTVLMPNTDIQQMKLIAIITGIDQPRAMIVDEKGVGYVTTRGDFVGKAEVVQSGGAENLPVTLNWRVDRIRENEVVLAREDPSGPNRPPLTRVIPLHDEESERGEEISPTRPGESG